ncbi:MAG: TetR/AcrR family transcriptional regulator [Erysipelotrichaceae bacterium]|nr:TetR/AcrR family transcriptional regulator [Erysipelotrichaceae bacterium]
MSTKDRILDASLTLFAKNGYDGTSVEQIASSVGIKAPSLYKHFKGKEDILNSLIDAAEQRYEENFGSADHIGNLPANMEEFIRSSIKRTSFTMSDPMIRKIRMFLVQEQFRSERLADITTRHQIDGLQKMYTRIMDELIKKGLFRKDDPSLMALEFVSPVVLFVSEVDRKPEYEEEAMKLIEKHIRHFCDTYKK